MDYQLTCPVCETTYYQIMKYCGECGCNLTEVEAVTVTVNPNIRRDKLVNDLRNQVQTLGYKTQQGLSGASSIIKDKASFVAERTNNIAVQKKVSVAMANLVNMMINVSSDVTSGIPSEMVNAIDLSARVNFVAFSIGVSIDLASLNKEKNSNVARLDSSGEDSSQPQGPDIDP